MQINLSHPREIRLNTIAFIVIFICSIMCMSFTVNNNDGKDKRGDVIAPSIGPSDESVISPKEPSIGPSFVNKTERKTNVRSITYESNDSRKFQKEKKTHTTATIKPSSSIGPSSSETSTSVIKPNRTIAHKTSIKNTKTVAKPVSQTIKKTSLQLVSSNYMARQRKMKKGTKSTSIIDMVNKKIDEDKSKRSVVKSLLDANKKKTNFSMTHTSINWLTWDEAMRRHAQEPRKVIVELYTDWCTWCKKMDKTTFQDPSIVQYINENFYAVKFDAETKEDVSFKGQKFGYIKDGNRGYNLFSLYLTRGRLTFPSIIFLDETINSPQPVKGFQSVSMMDRLLQFFGENYYKKMDWSLFNESFESASK